MTADSEMEFEKILYRGQSIETLDRDALMACIKFLMRELESERRSRKLLTEIMEAK